MYQPLHLFKNYTYIMFIIIFIAHLIPLVFCHFFQLSFNHFQCFNNHYCYLLVYLLLQLFVVLLNLLYYHNHSIHRVKQVVYQTTEICVLISHLLDHYCYWINVQIQTRVNACFTTVSLCTFVDCNNRLQVIIKLCKCFLVSHKNVIL